uniref:RNA helicase n=1 Tax=Arion vulgaris TaxID=1028688 RepID=A0A0B6ZDY2_9EUPU
MLKIIPLRCGMKVPQRLASRLIWQSISSTETDENLIRITCPKKLKDQFESRQKKRQNLSGKFHSHSKGQQLISCKRKDYNFYKGEKFDSFNVKSLVSCGWKNSTRRVGDHFTLLPHSENPSLQLHGEEDMLSFHELGINERLCAGLQELGFERPTEIQKLAIPSLLRGENAICAAETGSGKTLAYLLSAIELILRQRNALKKFENSGVSHADTNENNPSTVIITPNRELTHQVMSVAETLQPYADFVPYCLSGGTQVRRPKASSMDVLVSTPGILKRFLASNRIHRTNLQHLIIDESDTLLDDSFITDLIEIIRLFQVSPAEIVDSQIPFQVGTQIVLFSATLPRNVEDALGDVLSVDSMSRITTDALHQLQPHVNQKFIRVQSSSKPEKLITLLKDKVTTTLVFVKNNKTCYYIAKLLEENGVDCLMLNGDMSSEDRAGVFNKFKEGYSNILIATDIISRGLDTTNVQHVVNYDFPTFMSDYIHRVGRVGRVGVKHTGYVTSFVTYKWDVDLLWKIETAARSKKKLDNVNANIKKALNVFKPTDDDS